MIEKFLGFLKTMQESHTEYHNFNLFSINCQRRTSIMWQLFLYRAAEKKKINVRTIAVKPGKCCTAFSLPGRPITASICAAEQLDPPCWPEAWNDPFHFPLNSPSWQQVALLPWPGARSILFWSEGWCK